MPDSARRNRWLGSALQKAGRGRLLVLTGARQTGKTTLARARFPHLTYFNLDSPEIREGIRLTRTDQWADTIGPAILDEAQKEPSLFDKVKFAFDAGAIGETVLLGSSQILMLQRVRETLAGRVFVFELWPLLASELCSTEGEELTVPLLGRLLSEPAPLENWLGSVPALRLGDAAGRAAAAIDHLTTWGGMPGLLALEEQERRKWLQSYEATYLERDLTDLVRLADLLPFRQFQRLAAARTGQLLSYSSMSREAGVAAMTARRYLEYLQLSYQAFLLPPYATNLTSSLVKAPKVYWIDLGLWRHLTRYQGALTGAMFETLVVTEIYKWVKTTDAPVDLAFYRTRSGLEVDLLLTTPHGVLGLEAKLSRTPAPADWRGLRSVGEALGSRWRGGIVVYRGATIEQLATGIWAVPVDRLLVG